MKRWIQSVFIVFVVIGILGLSVEMVSFRYWVTARQEVSRLYADMPKQSQSTIGEHHLAGLPEKVQEWLRVAGISGHMHTHSMRTRMEFSVDWNQREFWRDGSSHLYVNAVEPGFVWMGTSKELPFVRLCGKSVFLKDREEETYPLLSVGRAQILQGEKLREKMRIEYLYYLPWMPAAAVNDYLEWVGLGDNQVRVILTQDSDTVEGVFSFQSDGFLRHLKPACLCMKITSLYTGISVCPISGTFARKVCAFLSRRGLFGWKTEQRQAGWNFGISIPITTAKHCSAHSNWGGCA